MQLDLGTAHTKWGVGGDIHMLVEEMKVSLGGRVGEQTVRASGSLWGGGQYLSCSLCASSSLSGHQAHRRHSLLN